MSLLSIIIPAYNEGALIQNTASVVADIMEKHSIDYEIVFVNDGSKDATWDEIQKAHRNRRFIALPQAQIYRIYFVGYENSILVCFSKTAR